MLSKSTYIYISVLFLLVVLLAAANLLFGSVDIPAKSVWGVLCGQGAEKESWNYIICESRVPQCVTALLCGAALSASGLMLQTVFGNPLADSSILGISSGASLGAALVLLAGGNLFLGGGMALAGFFSVVLAAFCGSVVVMAVLFVLSSLIKDNVMLLIAGIMIGYVASSVISLLNFFSTAEGVHAFVSWGLGNFGGVSKAQLPWFAVTVCAGLFLSLLLVKPLNALLLGTSYAANLGVNVRRVRNILLAVTGLLTAATTAFCGPIAFIGLAVPHMARLLLGSSNHNVLLPVVILMGAAVALFCNLVCILPGEWGVLPLNAVTPIVGAPVIIYVIVNRRRLQYFN